jgi:hypothetical protein
MENTKEISRVEQAAYNMREEIKNAILNEKLLNNRNLDGIEVED